MGEVKGSKTPSRRTVGDAPSSARASVSWRIIVADDHALLREGMRTLLKGEPDFEVVAEARDGQEALKLCREHHPDLVLMDVRMPKMDGLEATRKIKEENPQISVLMVTSYKNPDYLVDAIKAGAAGYVLKEITKQQLITAMRRVLEGESPLNQELAMRLLRQLLEEAPKEEEHPETSSVKLPKERLEEEHRESLSPRETEVLNLMARGKGNKEISEDLFISQSTVKKHVQSVISKLGVSDRVQASIRAIELGLVSKPEG